MAKKFGGKFFTAGYQGFDSPTTHGNQMSKTLTQMAAAENLYPQGGLYQTVRAARLAMIDGLIADGWHVFMGTHGEHKVNHTGTKPAGDFVELSGSTEVAK